MNRHKSAIKEDQLREPVLLSPVNGFNVTMKRNYSTRMPVQLTRIYGSDAAVTSIYNH